MNKGFKVVAMLLAFAGFATVYAQEPAITAPSITQQTLQDEVADAPVEAGVEDSAEDGQPALTAQDLRIWLDGYLGASLASADIAGAVVSVVKDGEILLSQGYGHADVEADKPMDPARTLVRVGSTSKLFTWTAVMQLVEQGRLDLDQDVNEYLDFRLPERDGRAVTMNDLMTHRGGFEEGLKALLITDPELYISNETYLKEHMRPRIFAAGETPAYSNYGTALAGYIVERISGEPFDDYVDRHLLEPLGMAHSSFRQPLPPALAENLSRGYMTSKDEPWPFEFVTSSPAGSLSATADDMAKFMLMHLQQGEYRGQVILRAETAQQMHSPSAPSQPGFATLAHGFFYGEKNGHRFIGHGGDTVVFHTDMNLLPDEGVGFFVSFNSRGSQDAVYGVRQRLFDDFMDRYFPADAEAAEQPALANAAEQARAVAGYYQSSRRIETAFLKLVYVLQQAEVVANEDGTLGLSAEPDKRFRYVAANTWREEGGDKLLHIAPVDGRLTLTDSDNPVSVMQAVPAAESAGLNLFVLLASAGVLLFAVLAWPVAWRYRRLYRQPPPLAGRSLLAYRLARVAALASLAYLVGWYFAFQPLLQNQLDAYGLGMDGLLRSLQFAAVVPLVAAAVGLWNVRLSIGSGRWGAILFSLVLAAALLGVVWVAWVGKLMGFNLEY
ncbi:serine hydrolase domain-containing protein [Parahaliea aestuarii]|uniref:Beta-lactamase family protein n=1 Tax=Parahaliea aestuarii TaxID=1852021 RepID=A0A5C8ZLN3_9GAMM|nr:serine hydrolase domain-containing protein [Parahaliea aestuarii]TXS89368.1 beta-lactamase family protein [Parahaliea aestuarii]